MSINPYKFDESKRKTYLDNLREGMRRGAAAEDIGVTRATVAEYRKDNPDFVEAETQAEMDAHEQIEDALFQAGVSGNTTAMIFYLCNRIPDKWRHVQHVRQETEHSGGLRIIIEDETSDSGSRPDDDPSETA